MNASSCICANNSHVGTVNYRVSIKSFPDYKHILQENYVEYKLFFYHYLS